MCVPCVLSDETSAGTAVGESEGAVKPAGIYTSGTPFAGLALALGVGGFADRELAGEELAGETEVEEGEAEGRTADEGEDEEDEAAGRERELECD